MSGITRKIRSLALLVTGSVAFTLAPLSAASATTTSEKRGCEGYHSVAYNQKKLYNAEGSSYHGEGTMTIYYKWVNGHRRFCGVGFPPSDESAWMRIQVGTRAQGSLSNPVRWGTTSDYVDSGTVSQFIGGVAVSPSKKRCAAFRVTMRMPGGPYKRTLTYDLCN